MAAGGSFSSSVQGGSEETFDYICLTCENRYNKTVEATNYCTDCDDFYCVICLDLHNNFPALKNHEVLGQNKIKIWDKQKSKFVSTEPCSRHSGQILKTYCSDHGVLCCHVCVSLEHRMCKGMKNIAELAKGINQSSEIKNMNLYIDTVISEIEKLKTTRQQNKTTLDKSRKDAIECNENIRKRVNSIFDNLEKKANEDIDKHYKDNNSHICADIKTCDDYLTELQQVKQKLQTTNHKNKCQIFINIKKCQQQIDEHDNIMESVTTTARVADLKFNINPELEKILTNIQSLGEFETTTPDSNAKIQQTMHPYTLKNRKAYYVKIKEDKRQCFISGSCQMPCGSLLLADSFNNKLKQLDSLYRVTNHCDLPASPIAVCCMGPHEAAVSGNDQTIHFLSVGSTSMTITRSIKTDHKCCGLAFNIKNDNLYVADSSEKVYIYNASGSRLHTLYKDNNGVEMFSETRHIAVSTNGTKIYIADNEKGLVTLTADGKLVSTFRDKDLSKGYAVCVDGKGSVYVSNRYPTNIIQLDEAGTQKLGATTIENNPNKHAQSICVDIKKSKFVATFDISLLNGVNGSNDIWVYDFAGRGCTTKMTPVTNKPM